MTLLPDVEVGQLYAFVEGERRLLYKFAQTLRDGTLVFSRAEGKEHGNRKISRDQYEDMRSSGRLVRVQVARPGTDATFPDDIDPAGLLDPEEAGIPLAEKGKRIRARQRLAEARTLRFYCVRYDLEPVATRGTAGLRNFIMCHRQDAVGAGHEWMPSPSALLRAIKNYGVTGERPLALFMSRGKHRPEARWHVETLRLRKEMVD